MRLFDLRGSYTPSISGSRNEYWSWSIDASILSSGTDYIIRLLQTPSDDIGPATDVLMLDPGGTESYVDLLWGPPQNANSAGLTHYRIRRRASITDPWIVVEDNIAYNTVFKRIDDLDPGDNFEVELTTYGINDNTAEVVLDQTDLQTVLARGEGEARWADELGFYVLPGGSITTFRPPSALYLRRLDVHYTVDLASNYDGPNFREFSRAVGTPGIASFVALPSNNLTALVDNGVSKIVLKGVFNGDEDGLNAVEELIVINVSELGENYAAVDDVYVFDENDSRNELTTVNTPGLPYQVRFGLYAGPGGVQEPDIGNDYEVFLI